MQDWLAARAAVSPLTIATYEDKRDTGLPTIMTTYSSLNHAVANACAHLARSGVRRGDKLGVLMANSTDYVTVIYAAARLGAVLVPLNTRLTVDELGWQLDRADCRWLIYSGEMQAHAERLTNGQRPLLPIDEFRQRQDDAERYLTSEIDLDAMLAIVFTSGTSGQPKGAALTYGNFFNSALASAYRIGTLPNDKWLCCMPLYHVGGLSIILRCCLYGTTVVLQKGFSVDGVSRALRNATLISLVPTMLYRLLQAGKGQVLKRLRVILLGGAAASPDLLRECEALGLRVATTYGLSEAASQVATMLPQEAYSKPGSVGKPLLFTSVRIVDALGASVPPGAYGEIVVSGGTVMQGYFNDADATAKTLRNGELHTGDIGYLDADGDLFVVQRRSDLIVSGGENVYPAEVESVLRVHPAVADVCVVGVPDAEWGQRVAAAVVLRERMTVSADDLLAFSRDKLAGYKQPRLVRFVESLPQTASGKIQRAAVMGLFGKED